MTLAQRREARIALAMLPVGAIVTVGSAFALLTVIALAVSALIDGRAGWGWTLLWYLVAVAASVRNLRAGIEIMSAFDWRPLPGVAAVSIVVTAAWPGWWLP